MAGSWPASALLDATDSTDVLQIKTCMWIAVTMLRLSENSLRSRDKASSLVAVNKQEGGGSICSCVTGTGC
jgi:hypothetical protein